MFSGRACGRGGLIDFDGESGGSFEVSDDQVHGELSVTTQRGGDELCMLVDDVADGEVLVRGAMAVQLGFVEELLPDDQQGRVAASCDQCGVEASMRIHPLWARRPVDCPGGGDRQHVVGSNQSALPLGVAVVDRFADGETFDAAARPGEVDKMLGGDGSDAEARLWCRFNEALGGQAPASSLAPTWMVRPRGATTTRPTG